MVLWPFQNNRQQKYPALVVLIIGVISIVSNQYLNAGIILSLFGLVYLLDSN